MSRLFKPVASATLAVTAASGSVALPGAFNASSQVRNVRLYNGGSVEVCVTFGTSAVTAATTDMRIPPGVVEIFHPDRSATHIAAITDAGSATLRITTGEGE